jgi:putative ABC transport system substrate-binding protein
MQFDRLKRREFITLIGSAAVAWPLTARAQQPERMRRIGVLMGTAATGQSPASLQAFLQQLQALAWTDGRNARIDVRWSNSDLELMRANSAELIALGSEVIVVQSNPALAALRLATSSIPIVFIQVADPVGSGFIASLARPGGNITGFTNFEPSMGSKWLELLKEAAPNVMRALVLLHAETAANVAMTRTVESAGPSLGVAVTATGVHDAAEIERAVTALAGMPNGAIIAIPHTVTELHRNVIIALAARHRLPTIFAFRHHPPAGALMSYGIDADDITRRAAGFVDRILRGAKPSDLPVQAPNKFELAVNLKTAKALGLKISPMLLARADEVIE